MTTGAVLVTGANRGLGLEHARQYAATGWRVLACARRPDRAIELQALHEHFPDTVSLHELDVTDAAAVERLADDLAGQPLDILLNNAGTFGPQGAPEGLAYQSLDNMDYDIWRQMLEVNLIAPFRLSVALAGNLRLADRPLLVMMSSDLGSITNNANGQSHAYRTSKAGLNMLTRGMSLEWTDIIVVSMAPGWCRTDLGGPDAVVDPVESVDEQQKTFARLGQADSGRFIDRYGETVAW
jgi:NAD(P)-dependent dehydrogenase (short-subunit alcohol dehydrogenase family)